VYEDFFLSNEEEKNRKKMRLIGVYAMIPFVLAVPPVIGWYIGHWLDKKLDTSPILMYVLLVLGFLAGVREFYHIVKKYGNDEI